MAEDAEDKTPREEPDPKRRAFLSNAAMAAGLAGGYGTFALISGRFLYPARDADRAWQFVIEENRLAIGDSIRYQIPGGGTVNITRKERNGDAGDFIALSSTCPHLGCQVHWEAQNNRYFCPCHNGVFDPDGVGTGGPPGDAGQSLPRYDLRVEQGMLFIEVRTDLLAAAGDEGGLVDDGGRIEGPGHDPCLAAAPRKAAGDRRT